jgi:Leucine-rich repeat (LRR) protein
MTKHIVGAAAVACLASFVPSVISLAAAQTASPAALAGVVQRIEQRGGFVVRDKTGIIEEVSLARTWATDNDVDLLVEIKTIKRLDLSFTYVTDIGIKKLQQLRQLEELNLDTAEFVTDISMAYLRANPALRWLRVRGVDITDAGMPYVGQLTGLRTLDLSHTMLGDVGLEHLPSLSELEDLKIGGDMITGLNLNFLKLLPKLKRLSFNGIQRRNAGACWTPRITDLDLDTISLLSGLEELDLGVGLNLGMGGKPAAPGGGNCRVTGGLQVTDLGLSKLATLKNLRRLTLSGARLTPAGLKVLQGLPLERLSLWNCPALDDAAAEVLGSIPTLASLDVSYTTIGDRGLQRLAQLPNLKALYLTETKVTPEALDAFKKQNPNTFVSWARRPAPRAPLLGEKPVPEEMQ